MPRHLTFFQSGLLILSVALVSPAFAGETAPSPPPSAVPKIQVQALTPDADLAPYQKTPRYETHAALSPRPQMLSPAMRDRLLSQAGLSNAVRNWDDVDRDVFFMRAGSLDFERFKAHYPQIPAPILRKFQELVRQ